MNTRNYIYFFIFFVYFMTRQLDINCQNNFMYKGIDSNMKTYSPFSLYFEKIRMRKINIPNCYSINNLPFFCKLEAKWDKKINIPIRFRLGSVDYVDELEGKRNWKYCP